MEKNKCKKYEGLFVFADGKDFLSHLETCPDCQAEYARMQRVSELIQEVAPIIKQERKDFARVKLACVSFGIIFCFFTLGFVNLNQDVHDIIMYGQTMSVEDYGFPVDSYGLLMVD